MPQSQYGPPPGVTLAASSSMPLASRPYGELSQAVTIRTSFPQGPPMTGLPPAFKGHFPQYSAESGQLLIGITCMLLVLCTTVVSGRLVARRMAKVTLEADDYLVIVALVGCSFEVVEKS